jgi:DNA-binding response OmpR family regulator
MRIACYIRCANAFKDVQGVLASAGFDCERFESEIPLLRALRREEFDLILADTESHPVDEKTFYSWLNCRTHSSIPVVLISSALDARSVALALNAGADDFINRPVDPQVLVARLRVVLRRYRPLPPHGTVDVQGFTLDKNAETLLDHGKRVELTPREFALAWLFFTSPGKFLSHQTISVAIWAVGNEIARHSIEQHVYKLRKKLNLSNARGVQIRNAYTKGYRLELCEPAPPPAPGLPRAEPQSQLATADAKVETALY